MAVTKVAICIPWTGSLTQFRNSTSRPDTVYFGSGVGEIIDQYNWCYVGYGDSSHQSYYAIAPISIMVNINNISVSSIYVTRDDKKLKICSAKTTWSCMDVDYGTSMTYFWFDTDYVPAVTSLSIYVDNVLISSSTSITVGGTKSIKVIANREDGSTPDVTDSIYWTYGTSNKVSIT